jgi:hypothetical protein
MECPNQTKTKPMPNQCQTKPPGQPQKSMSQHQCHNTDSTLKTTKPTKTPKIPKIPNRQKSQKPTTKNFRAEKKSQQKFPQQQNKNLINYNLFSQSRIQSFLDNL